MLLGNTQRTLFPLRNIVHSALALTAAIFMPTLATPWVYLGAVALGGVFMWARNHSAFQILHSTSYTSYGEFFFILGTVLSFFVFSGTQQNAWYTAMFVLAFADPLATFIGTRYGHHTYHIRGERRTIEGTLTCALVATVVFTWVQVPIMHAFMGGIIIACIENVSLKGSDNVTLPLAAGFFASVFV